MRYRFELVPRFPERAEPEAQGENGVARLPRWEATFLRAVDGHLPFAALRAPFV